MSLTESLEDLYRLDRQVRGLQSRLAAAQRFLDAQDHQLGEAQAARDELITRKRHLQATIANFETEGSALDERLEKYRADLNNAVTQKQYTAVLTELNTVKTARGKTDDEILSRMADIETIDDQLVEAEALMVERAKLRDVAANQYAEREQEVGERLRELETQRDAAADRVPATERSIFDQLADAYDGEAMAPVEEIDRRRREYSCGACNMHLPFAHIAGLMSPNFDQLVRCTACRRILYLQEDLRGALTKK